MLTLHFAAAARVCLTPGLLLLFASCAGLVPEVPTPAADPSAGVTRALPRSVLETDDVTRKTQQLLTASGASRLEGLKPVQHGMPMGGMDHQGMAGMTSMPGADHSKMPGMQRQPPTGASAGEQHHGGMKEMDHSRMPGAEHSGGAHHRPQTKQSVGTSSGHGAHGDHGGKQAAPSSPVVPP